MTKPDPIDLLKGVPNVPRGWQVKWKERGASWSLEFRMPPLVDGLQAFLLKRHLWDVLSDMPCGEYLAVADAVYLAKAKDATKEDVLVAKSVLAEFAWDAAANVDQQPLKRLSRAIEAVNDTSAPSYKRISRDSYLYRLAFTAFCFIQKRLPTKKELTAEAEDWKVRKRFAARPGQKITTEIFERDRVKIKDPSRATRDRRNAGFGWLPESHSSKGQRSWMSKRKRVTDPS